ncbi:hypothetical protein LTR78_006610 [Recurvomyces mirabilis]|uniref:Amino acid transporter n=1 Tax=Recurvomyces mirabilis TaxID=574656 RepID=A0AAE0WKG9_9PEZI|nr:hypothetical protein LTR78_006610 [Recurvomyces mirabilis]KAK5151499.1 hypothetical protein LTS14_009343 [Recurvomyces mirabilis]
MSAQDPQSSMFRGASMELSSRPQKTTAFTGVTAEEGLDDKNDLQDEVEGSKKSSLKDAVDMRRMGKQQLLVRRFRQLTIAAFIGTTTAAWEYALFLVSPGLVDGGTAGLLYNVIWSFFGFGAIYLSLAEMASMAPIAGSLYHWVSEFAPENVQGIMSYFTGWISTIAWQAGYAQGILLAGTQIQTIILVMNDNYEAPAWQGTLLSFAAILISYGVNVYGVRSLPYWQVPVFAIGTMAYFAYIVPVWCNAPTATHEQVWSGFSNTGGWSSMTLAVLVGQLSGISMQTGVDTAAHMAEEVKDAAVAVPRAMMTIFLIDFALVFPLLVTICYHLPDIDAALNDTTAYPGIYIMRQAMSDTWIAVIMAVITFICMASNITYLAGVSRDLFAFARDKGLPFSPWFSKVDPKRSIPVNANLFSCVLSAILALIYIGSPVAFYAITSLNTVSLLQCYVFAIGCVLWRRIKHPETLPPARFSLGRFGVPVNIAAVVYSAWSCFWCFWPQSTPVDAGGFNWASPLYILALIVSALYYLKARHRYEGPVVAVEGRNVHAH